MATLLRQPNDKIYIYHWFNSKEHFKTSTKIAVSANDWDKAKQLPKNSKLEYKTINVKAELLRHIQAMESAVAALGTSINKENLKQLYKANLIGEIEPKQDEKSAISLIESIDTYVENNEIAKATIISYEQLKVLCNKISFNPLISDINSIILRSFVNKCNAEDYAKNTIRTNLKKIRAVLNWSLREGLHTNTAYKEFKYSPEESDSVVLSREEIQKIVDCEVPAKLQAIKDYFIAAYYTALRLSDWESINLDKVDDDGIFSLRSTKTGITSYVPASPVLMEILEKWEREGQPKLQAKATIGRHLVSLCKLAGIDTPVTKRITKGGDKVVTTLPKYNYVTTHTARRSMATNLILEGISPYVAMSVTGHKTIESFSTYVKYQDIQAKIQLKNLSFFQ